MIRKIWLWLKRFASEHPVVAALVVALSMALGAVPLVVGLAYRIEARLFDPGVALAPWKRTPRLHDCKVSASSGMWLSLQCGTQRQLALPAGVILSADGKKDEPVALQPLLQLGQTGTSAGFECELVDVSDGGRSAPYADCKLAGLDLSLLLLTSGAVPAPPRDSAAWASLKREQQAAVVSPPKPPSEDTRRSAILSIQGWLATLLGLLGAGAGFAHGAAEKSRRSRETGEYLRYVAEFDIHELDTMKYVLKEPLDEKPLEDFKRVLERLRGNLIKFLEHHVMVDYEVPKLFVQMQMTLDGRHNQEARETALDQLSGKVQKLVSRKRS